MIDLHCHSTASDGHLRAGRRRPARRRDRPQRHRPHRPRHARWPRRGHRRRRRARRARGWWLRVLRGRHVGGDAPARLLPHAGRPRHRALPRVGAAPIAAAARARWSRAWWGSACGSATTTWRTRSRRWRGRSPARGARAAAARARDHGAGRRSTSISVAAVPAFVEKALPTLREVADLVHAKGGIVSAAHLKWHGTRATLAALQRTGSTRSRRATPVTMARREPPSPRRPPPSASARSGGSDWHGEFGAAAGHSMLGAQEVPDEWLDELEARRPTGARAA